MRFDEVVTRKKMGSRCINQWLHEHFVFIYPFFAHILHLKTKTNDIPIDQRKKTSRESHLQKFFQLKFKKKNLSDLFAPVK